MTLLTDRVRLTDTRISQSVASQNTGQKKIPFPGEETRDLGENNEACFEKCDTVEQL